MLTVSDELLEDGGNVQAYLNSRLSLFVRHGEETSVLRGGGTNDLVGLMDGSRGINTYAKAASDDNATCIARSLANTAGSSYLTPDTVILHPDNWLSTRLLRDGTGGTAGNFLGGGPFTGAYGTGGAADAALFGGQLWNTRVVLSTVVGKGAALLGHSSRARGSWTRRTHARDHQQPRVVLCVQPGDAPLRVQVGSVRVPPIGVYGRDRARLTLRRDLSALTPEAPCEESGVQGRRSTVQPPPPSSRRTDLMALTNDQDTALAQLQAAYPGGIGFGPDRQEAIAIYDSLVELGYADVITEHDDPQLPAGGRSYVLSRAKAEAEELLRARAANADQN